MEFFDKDLISILKARNLARLGKVAANKISDYSEDQIEKILKNMVKVAVENSEVLAEMAVEETGFGNVKDKIAKNKIASEVLYEAIKDMKTIDVIKEDLETKVMEIAEPMGLLMGIIPSTNPTSTTIFKSIISLKSRNAIVFSPHPSALKCTSKAVKLMHDAAVEAGAPQDVISCITDSTIEATNELMKVKEVSLIIATGGPGMVKAAYSSGKPALGVGAGNSPAYIEKSAKIQKAVENIIASKTFDYGTICASEQSIICEYFNEKEVIAEFEKQGGYFMSESETERVCKLLFRGKYVMNPKFVGRSAQVIAKEANINIPTGTKVLIGRQNGVGDGNPLSFEKLTTVLGFYVVNDWKEACDLSIELLQNGIGHTMSLHTEDRDIVLKFAKKPASRILVNTGGSQGGTGASTGLMPSFTLGCGTWGGSSVSENVTPMHLINIKRVAYGLIDCKAIVKSDECENIESQISNNTINMSPAEILEASQSKSSTTSNLKECENLIKDNINNEELLNLVSQIIESMKRDK